MTKLKITKEEKLEDLLISQLQILRLRLVENIDDIDIHIQQIKRRFKK